MRASARKPPKSLPLAKATGAGCRRAELALSQPRRLRAGSFPSSGSLPSWRTGLRPLLCTSSGEEGAAPRVCLLPVQDSCIPALVYSSAPGTCSDPTEGFWGTAFSPPRPSSPSPELLLEQDEQREEGRSQQVRDCRSMLAWWLGNQLNPLRICSPWRHYSVPGGAGPYYRGHAGCPPLAVSQQLCCCTPTVPGSQPPPRHGSCPTERQKHREPTPCAFNPRAQHAVTSSCKILGTSAKAAGR